MLNLPSRHGRDALDEQRSFTSGPSIFRAQRDDSLPLIRWDVKYSIGRESLSGLLFCW